MARKRKHTSVCADSVVDVLRDTRDTVDNSQDTGYADRRIAVCLGLECLNRLEVLSRLVEAWNRCTQVLVSHRSIEASMEAEPNELEVQQYIPRINDSNNYHCSGTWKLSTRHDWPIRRLLAQLRSPCRSAPCTLHTLSDEAIPTL